MTEEGRPGYRERGKPYRRRRKYQGATWAPPSMSAEVEDGEYCKRCKQRHGYMTLGVKYEQAKGGEYDGRWKILWLCPNFHHVVGEKIL